MDRESLSRRAGIRVTFVLPGDGRSGGVRVTVIMANLLLGRGYRVRIALPRPKASLRRSLLLLREYLSANAGKDSGFLYLFRGGTEFYGNINDIEFESNEIVIAVGTYTVDEVRRIRGNVMKVRFNHGFPAEPSAKDEAAWRGGETTITVSNTLVPKLQELTEGNAWGVVPNGVDPAEYFVEPNVLRDGIGALYNRHSNKAPEDLIAVLREAHSRWPEIPQYVFGTESRPAGLEHVRYSQLPSVDAAREIYNRSKLWLVTSRTEGLPGVVLEAMACGCAVVSSDNDGSLEIIKSGSNGLIVRRGDRLGFVAAIGSLLDDDTLRQGISSKGLETVKSFTWERAADRMEAFLASLTKEEVPMNVRT